jgi:acetyl-CoA carboxylase biotin carboxylase subunit
MIRHLLVANRGEIAVRIVRACREAGVESVAIYSDADAAAPHVVLADRAVRIGPAPAAESYLHVGRIIDAARASGADAVHPGYGFLAENPAFADACADAGLIFVGPPADVMARLGAKPAARRLAMQAGVPVVPGLEPDGQSETALVDAARRFGTPLLVKAAAGGGGKGMRLVRAAEEIEEAIGAARREALAAFGDGTLYFERLLERPRHVEIQIFADAHGRIVHLFERECSVQRRHQKVVEESPSPALTPGLRARMGEAAVAVARAAGYRNAGTVEFLVEGGGEAARFYFLEMNTRLQVEHPVTEAVTGLDLVRAQLTVAAGEPLPWAQEEIGQRGHAIECRVYAEDPAQGFLPQAGRLLLYREPDGPGIRVDSGVVEGSEVGVHYDPLLAKLVVHAETRAAAIARARTALAQFPILGVATNVSVLRRVLDHPAFRGGTVDAGFLEREIGTLLQPPDPDACALAAAAAAMVAGTPAARIEAAGASADADPWVALRGWRAGTEALRTGRSGGA